MALAATVLWLSACSAERAGSRDTPPPGADETSSVASRGSESSEAQGAVTREGEPSESMDASSRSGIRGTVLRGPVSGGPLVGNQPDEAPFAARFLVTDSEGNEVTRFESDEEGRFELALSPGDYVIVPDSSAPVFRPEQQPHEVTVVEGGMVEVTLRYDTGMR